MMFMVDNKISTAKVIAQAASEEFGVPILDIEAIELDVDVLKLHVEFGGQQSWPGVGRAGHHIRLHAAFESCFRFERSRCHQPITLPALF